MPSVFFSPNTYLGKKNDCFREWKFSMRLFNYSITQSTCAHSFRCTETHLTYIAQCHSVALHLWYLTLWLWYRLLSEVEGTWYAAVDITKAIFSLPLLWMIMISIPCCGLVCHTPQPYSQQGYQNSPNMSSTQKWWYGNIPLSEGATDFYSIDDIVLGPNMGTIKQRLDASQTHI